MKFICLEMLRLLVISFTTIEIEWNLEAMFVAHAFVLKCYVRPYSIVIVM